MSLKHALIRIEGLSQVLEAPADLPFPLLPFRVEVRDKLWDLMA